MQRQNPNQQMYQQQQQQQQYMQQQEMHQQQSISRTEHRVQRSQVTTQQRVEHHGGGYVQQQQPALTHIYAQGDISPPVFEQIFKNARFAQGGNALFEGKLRGNPKPFVSWTRKGAPLLESQKFRMSYNEATGEVSLLINQIGPGDEGEYTCTARNQYGEAICSVYIQPEGAPMPVIQPKHLEKSIYTNGYSFTSTKEEFRVDTFEYRLLREVSYREAITRRSTYEQDYYLCQELDRSMGPAHAPQIAQKPRNSKLIEGSDAVFAAKVGSNPKPRLTWFHNGQRLVQSNKYDITYSSGIATLRVKNANINDAGHYTLLAENTQGCVVSSAVLAVEPAAESAHEPKPVDATAEQLEAGKALPPTFVKAYGDREVTEGRMTRFDCRVTGNPYPEVYWFINGRQVNDDAAHKILVNESGSHSLMITNVTRMDAGAVQCLARNKAGEVAIEAQLNVLEKEQVVAPQFVQRFSTMTVREGEPITMSANAIGTPMPRITWQKDGQQISSTADRFIGIDGGATCLEIPRVKASDAGWYQCTAQNIAGSTANRARLYVEVPREQPPVEQRRLNLPRPTKIIEPEPQPGPEIIYLRHVERAKPHLRPGEEDRVYPPPQFIIPLQNVQQVEGGKVHMEARIEPVGDPTMVVEWFLNGHPLAASSRATSVFKFGFIALDLLSVMTHDSGEYMCRVTNAAGMAESRAILSVTQRPSIEQTSQHPTSLQYISQLEDYSRYQRQESTEELMNQPPVFIRPLKDLGEFEEGKNVHFEAQVTPVNDPTMRVEWYKDGRPITASSRITAIFNFGYVSLNIMHLRAEDAGTYTVRAVNRKGEAISTSTIRVHSRSQVTADLGIPEQQRYIEKVEELEHYRKSQERRHAHEAPEPIAPPQFKTQIQHQLDMREGGHAHFEARLEPTGDSTMRVEWFKDGQPLEASSRSTTFFNFGYVALTIKQLTIYDAGTYTCRAYNAMGQDTTTAQLSVISKKEIVSESQHPGGLEKIQHLEDSSRYGRTEEEETRVTQMPRFLGPMKGTNKIIEGQKAHFEARVEPQSDLSMQIEWYHNGRAITAANRIQMYYDFGYVALDISQVRAEDAGVYTVVARNKLGEAQLQGTMIVETRSSIDTSSMHRGLYEKTQHLENKQFVEPHYDIEEISKSKPIFVQPLSDPKPIHEGKNIHLECRLEPMGDPTMRVEWFQNGRPITVGSRFRTYYDFGFVALDIVQATSADSGEYTCRATNHLGSAHTSSCVRVIDRSDIVTETQNEMSLEQIQMLEDASRRRHHMEEEITVMQAPQFTRALHNIETVEGTNVHLECRLQPVGDPSMRVEWFVNGKPVKTGHRFRPAYEFDYVALDLLGCYAADSGVYTCQARNQLGEAVTSCSVRIIAKSDLILETQNESGLQKIAYLEDSSRYRRSEYVDEEVVNIRPRFLTHPKSLNNMREGGHAHFECKIEPVTDPNLKVEWFKNGRPITVGHRFRPIHDFGYVALDIVDLIAEDSGVYTCRAVNLIGSDETQVQLQCRSSEQIVTVTQNEAGLEQIHYLEDRSRYTRREEVDESTKQAPVFTTSLKNIEIKENQRAHFECRLIPVSDPSMRVEWYHNNMPLKSGSRFTETNNFGFVALDIMSCLPEDAGTYTCRAYNAVGEAITSAVAVVHTKKSIYLESQHESALPRLQHLEDSNKRQRMSAQEEIITQAPVFTMPVRDSRVAEGQAVHFEARLIPVGDPHLKVEWLRNGQPIEASNRITTMHDFGYVALNMKYVNPEDSGTYTCRATNELGQAVTSASLIVQSKTSIQMETQHEAAMHKIHQLEDHSRYQRREEEEYVVTQPPRFVTKLIGPTNLVEGQSAHYECRIEPYPDPNLKVEWLHNGKPLSTGHRFRTTYDFGFSALDILTVYAEDSGEYTCRVTNNLGEAVNSIRLNVQSRSSIIHETQHEEALQKIQHLEDGSRFQRKEDEDVFMAERPQFGRPLRNANTNEGKPVHLEATLTPVNDPTMKVEWYCNGVPIQTGHRFKTTYDFGFVALDILYAHAEDTGTYMCKAKNAVGEAVTTCAVNVTANKTLDLDTLDAERLEKIRQLESYTAPKKVEVEEKGQKPIFLTPLSNLEHLKEGEHAHLECRVEPINDPNLKIEWFCNGKQLPLGHRYRTTHDFGYVALDILYVYGEDTGTYMCKATNLLGEAVNTCNVRVLNRRSMILDTQHPDALEKIQKLESKVVTTRSEVTDQPISPPHFTAELRGSTEIYEGQTAHFEAQVQPVHDPNLRIEFYHNGKPLPSASRFHITFDFGYVALDITHAVAEDAGEYSVRAVNALGQCVSSTNLRVIARGTIIMDTQHSEGLEKIRKLESTTPFQRPELETPGTRQRPVFTQPLQNIDRINEHQTAHFECRLIPVGDPNLKVEWYRNEKLIEDSSRITKQHDFGFVSLDISHIRKEDEGVYMCRAVNPLGEAVTTASMRVVSEASIQLDTQHPDSISRIHQLERPAAPRPVEPERAFEKPIFTQLLTGPSELWEGQHAHFEARVVPVGDPSLKFEWYINGVELKMGSRLRTTNDFGFVTLDISSVVPEDAGVYMCRAYNAAGEAVSSTAMKIKTKSNIVGEPMIPESWEAIRLKEASMNRVPEMFVDTTPQQAPVFTTHLQSYDKLSEGQHVLLEAQVEPRADPNLRIEWFKNGVSLTTGSRIRSTFDFGLVTLSINGLRADDSAIYTCKATNQMGEAVSTCSLKIEDRHWLQAESLHPDSLPRIGELEAPKPGRPEASEPVYETPVFITHLNNIDCKESDNARFECNVEPSRDPTMQIEWFYNGQPLQAAAKFKSIYDFGYCALDMANLYAENSGVYTCKATNSKGSATTSGTLKCTSGKIMFLETQHPQGEAGLEAVKETEEELANRYNKEVVKPETHYPPPVWTRPLQAEFHLSEAQPLHLEANVEPKEDPNLFIEWYFNGKLLQHGSRFKMTSEFGFVTLDLIEVYERDQGIYTCKAYNKSGEAFTTTTIFCTGKDSIIEQTQHPKGAEGLEQIQDLEESLRKDGSKPEKPEEGMAPRFTTEFINIADIGEGEIAHYEANLVPTGDQSMVIEWFFNGKVLEASHRVRTIYAFGMVALEILGTKIEDTGTYTCRATNKYGSAEISCTLECVDKPRGQKPRFTSHIKSLEGLKDGQSAHFECTLIPVNDPELKVEWYHNGKLMRHSNRIKTVSDFGYVVLDISYLQDHDSGEYVCRAYNKYGEDFTRATLNCRGRGGVFYDSLQPDSLQRIRELECPQLPGESVAPVVAEPPKFITHIKDVTKLVEGQSVHFEARLTPITDPDLKVEWYFNGKKLPHGHRFRTFHDFGIVILDILYCYEENSGVYECRAVNKYGEDVTRATLTCSSKANLILDSQLPRGMEGGLEKIANLEYSMVRTRDETVEETKGKAPVFTVPLENIENLREGENCHFEARVTPTDDPKLRVEWYWNGRPLKAGSRFRTFCDFGFVILEISPVYPEDSGEYSCRAINEYGEAVTTATMKIAGKRSIIMESQLPKGMEGTIDRIAELEGLGVRNTEFVPEDDTGKPPEFITTPFDMVINENQLAHFECRLQPINDPSMRVDWFHNGKALWAGSRIKTINDFGFVILEIAGCYQRDSGLYTCKATNKHGEATVSCKLQVKGRQGIVMEPQLPSNFRTGTESLQKLEENMHRKDELVIDEEQPNPPKFIEEIKDNLDVQEGGPIHFDCRVEPVGDPTMRIEWFYNGRPLPTGSRVHQLNDFGFIALDIDYIYARDSGEYTCRAVNKWGVATTTAKVTCKGKGNIVYDTQLPDGMTAEKLKELDRGRLPEVVPQEEVEYGPPKFVTEIASVTVEEAEAVRFECQVEPKNDPNLRIEWYRNGKLLPSGHRYRNIFDMGFVSLDILYVYAEDSGEYVCRAYNKYGEDRTKATISCKQLPSIMLQNQVPRGMKRSETLTQMEATIKKYTSEVHLTEDDLFDPDRKQPPRFVTQIKDKTNLTEMASTKFECQLAPVGDPNMKVEWFFNGKPLLYKNRFQPIYDFGYVALNFGWVYPEDSGEYVCRATNLYGKDETRAIIKVAGKPGIVYDSQLPAHMQSIERIREMEASWQVVPEEVDPDARPRSKPVFVSKLEPQTVEEGEPARFCVRVTGYPRPRVMWLINGHTVVHGSRYKLTNDGMFHMDIPKTRQYDTGKVEVIARNSVGEAIASTELNVVARSDDYRGVLKNSPRRIVGSKDYRKPEWVTHMEEMQKALKAIKCTPSLVNELNDCRAAVGEKAKFKIQFAGNPKPDIQWYYNNVQLRESDKYHFEVGESDASLTILNCTYEDIGFYTCKLINEIGMTMTRGKFDISLTPTETEVTGKGKKGKGKKKVAKKTRPVIIPTAYTSSEEEEETKVETEIETTTIEIVPTSECETSMQVIKVRQPVSILVEQSEKSEEILVKDRKIADEELQQQTTTETKEVDVITTTTTTTTTTTSVEISETINILKKKISQKSITLEDVLEIRQHKEINILLESIEAQSFGVIGESALRDLATMGLLIRHGCTILEIIYMYEQNIFISLKKPEAQSALVQLVEREGHEDLISQILSESSTEDETILAATVGFKAFIRMIETYEISIETVIRKFVREDFITQDWKISGKERTVETTHVYESNEAITHIKIEETIVEERTIIVEEDGASLNITREMNIEEGDEENVMYSICNYVADSDEAMNLVEGEKVRVVGRHSSEWWFVKKAITEEEGWVPAQYLMEPAEYEQYVQKKLHEKIDKLPVFEQPPSGNAEPPLFVERFEEQNVPQKGVIRLPAKVTGNPVPEVEWLFNNNPLLPNERIQQKYDGENIELIIKDANPDTDSGDYKCIASNPLGKTSHGARVIVEVDEVVFTKTLKSKITIEEIQSLTLECETSHVVSTKWFFNDKELSGMDHRVVVEEGKTHKLVIKNTNLRDSGTYTCKVKDQQTKSTVEVIPRKPEFITPLEDYEVTEKDTAILEVEVSTDVSEMQWFKDGEKITIEKKNCDFIKDGKVHRLLIRDCTIHDEGEYSCKFADQVCKCELTVIELPPEIIKPLEDVTVTEGETATFTVELDKGDALIKWFKNGKEITFDERVQLTIDGKRQSITIKKAKPSDATEYSLKVGEQTSKAKLVVEKPLVEFIVPLPDVTLATKNTDAEFTVKLSQPDVEVTWFKKGKPIKPNKKHEVFVEGTVRRLVIHDADDDDAGEISCTAANVTTTTNLCVEEPKTPPIIISDKEQTVKVKENDDVTLTIKYTGVPKPDAEWKTSKKVVVKSNRITPTIDEQSASLTIRKVVEEDEDEYTVKLKNPAGEAEASLHLVIMRKPSAPGAPQPLEVMHDSITLFWKAPEDDGKSDITEYILEYKDVKTEKWTEIRKIKDTTYTLSKLVIDTEYVFRSIAVNEVGPSPPSPLSPPIRLVAEVKKEKPTVQEPLQDITTEHDKEITLSCVFGGVPEPKVVWKKNGKVIQTKTMRYENRVAKYTIEKTTVEDEAQYTCVAENEVGSVETTCRVTLLEKPTIDIDEKYFAQKLRTGNDMTIPALVKAYPKPKITWYKETTVLKTTKRQTIEINEITTTENKTILNIQKLTREDSGRYKLVAENTAGSTSVECNIKVIDKPSRPQSLEIKDIKKDSIKLEWTPPIDDGGLEINKYILEKCEVQNNVWMKVADFDKDITSYAVQKLSMNSQYMFRVVAINPIGESEPTESEPVAITKKFDKPSPPRAPIDVSGMNDTSFTLSWQESESDGGSKIIEYVVEIKEFHETDYRLLGSTNGNIPNILVTNVIKNKAYTFRIYAKNEVGMSEALETEDKIVVSRRITPPSPPQNLRCPDITGRSVTLDWEIPAHNGGSEITGYCIEKRSSTSTTWTKVITLDAHCLQYTVDNLKEKSEYWFRVSAENEAGLGAPAVTDSIALKTHATVPSPPTAPLEARVIAANAHVFEWGIPESDGGAPLLGYHIAIRDMKKSMWIEVGRVPAGVQKFQIRDLQENHEYMIRIFAKNEIGLSEPLESEEPYKAITSGLASLPDEPRTEMSTCNTSSWLRDHHMDADIHSYARGKLLRRDEYFFRLWAKIPKKKKDSK